MNDQGTTMNTGKRIQSVYPLSPMQSGILFHSIMDNNSGAYFMQNLFEIEGRLDRELLEASVGLLEKRYDILRTVFRYEKVDEPLQIVLRERKSSLHFVDLSSLGAEEKRRQLLEFRQKDRHRGFDLGRDKLMRFSLLKMAEEHYNMVVSYHHILMDGWCLGIIFRDLLKLYRSVKEGTAVPLPPVTPYRQYIDWLGRQDKEEGLKYWRDYLAGFHRHTRLPGGSRPDGEAKYRRDEYLLEIDEPLTAGLIRLARSQRVTVNSVFQTLWGILLQRYNGSDDVVFGAVVSGRAVPIEGIEEMVGLCINTIPVRITREGERLFPELLEKVHRQAIRSRPFEYLPLADIQAGSPLKRELIDHIMVFENFPVEEQVRNAGRREHLGYTVRSAATDEQTHYHFNIALFTGRRMLIRFLYNSLVYPRDFVESIAATLQQMAGQIVRAPRLELDEIKTVTPEAEGRILFEFNDTRAPFPEGTTIVRWFSRRAEQQPHRIALTETETGRSLSLGRLVESVGRLAGLLRRKGLAPDTVAAVKTERSLEMAVGILAVLKAGAAYLPLDPGYPPRRIRYMLDDSRARLVLNRPDGEIDPGGGTEWLDLKRLVDNEPADPVPPAAPLNSLNLAYVIYTSGSTGRPKGTLVQHRSVVNILSHLQQLYPMETGDAYLMKTNYTFDVSVTELFGWFFGQGRLVVPGAGCEKDPLALLELIRMFCISHINFVPSMLYAFLDFLDGGTAATLGNLKYVFVAGEAFAPALAQRIGELRLPVRFENIFGPTEATIYTSKYSYNPAEPRDPVPIGKPLNNIKLYILDRINRLSPLYLPGELCIAGLCLARGYLNRPELTHRVFTADPFNPGHRLYRTGDLARWLPDGNIEFLGRIDQQVKIRGFRIEPGEIESRLLDIDVIKETAVVAATDEEGQKYLCAYIVSAEEIDQSRLRQRLKGQLPDYMIPAYFLRIDRLPLTLSGKLDRGLLPDPRETGSAGGNGYVPARNLRERSLARVWSGVLGKSAVGIHDNFFAAGGDSIKAIQVVSRLHKEGFKIDLSDLFRNPTIAQLAPLVKKSERSADQSPVTGDLPLTPIQQAFFRHHLRNPHHYNQSVMLDCKEEIDEAAVTAVFSRLQEHHDALRTTFTVRNGGIRQAVKGTDHPLSLQAFDLRDSQNPAAAVSRMADRIQAGIDLEAGPLMRLALFQLADRHHLLIVIHHLVVDGISWRILFEDIETLFRCYRCGEPLALPPKTDSFRLWAEQLTAYAAHSPSLLTGELAYWGEQETIEAESIPADFEVAGSVEGDVRSRSFSLSADETGRLLTEVHRAFGTEINDVLLTALGLALKGVTGCDRLLVALEGHGREELFEDVDVSRTVGWFTTMYPLSLDFSFNTDLARQLKAVKERLRQVPRRGIGYGILRYLTPPELRRGVEFRLQPQLSFNYLGQFDAEVGGMKSFGVSRDSGGRERSLNQVREHDLEVTGLVAGGCLHLSIRFSGRQYREETMAKWWSGYRDELVRLIDFCSARREREWTPSDFTYRELTLEQLEGLLDRAGGGVEDIYPLSPMQEGMLFHALYDGASTAYFEQLSYRLGGDADAAVVRRSLVLLMQRYDILRTVFFHEGLDRPLQLVLAEREEDFHFQESLPASVEEREAYVSRYREADRARGFDLSRDVLLRVSILRLGEWEYEFIWSHHHILMDGWCMGIIISEFLEIYRGLLEERQPRLPAVVPYRNYISWLERQDRERSRLYWKQYLLGYETIADIGRIKPPVAASAGFRNEQEIFPLSHRHSGCLNRLAAEQQVTLNSLFQAVWGLLLGRYTGREDVVFGAVVAGRPAEIDGVESMVGLFINTIPVRIFYDGGTPFGRLIRRVQRNTSDCESHSHYPLVQIQAESPLKQNLLDHIFLFENYPLSRKLEGLSGAEKGNGGGMNLRLSSSTGFEQSNYNFNIVVLPERPFRLLFIYNGCVFPRRAIAMIAAHFEFVLQQVIDDPRRPVGTISLLPEEQRRRLVKDFNATTVPYPRNRTIHGLFDMQARQAPDRLALVCPDGCLTYGELEYRSRRLAGCLTRLGVDRETIAAVPAEHRLSTIVAILGVLKTGAAYLPLNYDYPPERRRFLLEDGNVEVLLSRQPPEPDFPGRLVDPDRTGDPEYDDSAPPVEGREHVPTHLAYLMYTSGSTGRPKGVMVAHRSVVRLVKNNHFVTFAPDDAILQTGALDFDAATFEIWGALLNGLRLYLMGKETILSAEVLKRNIVRYRISTMWMTSPLFNQMLDADEEIFAGLSNLLVGGDALSAEHVNRLRRRYPGLRVINGYGPTENTTFSATHSIDEEYEGSIPLGRPLANSTAYVVDGYGGLQPPGVAGELWVGGDGVARGYLNNPELSAERFCKSTFGGAGRLYRTGDLCRWNEDGLLEFLGRLDHQVKIRGFRIEPGEVENRLLGHVAIREAVVLVRESGAGEKYLCAYIVPVSGVSGVGVEMLKLYLRASLPDYMVPLQMVELDRLPLTPNGKVDRRRLPEPELGFAGAVQSPRDALDVKLLEIVSELLGIDRGRLGIEADFFDLGGHSLKATMLSARVHRELNVRLPLVEVFKSPTIRELADYIRGSAPERFEAVKPVEKKEYYPLSSAQKRLYFMQEMEWSGTSYHISQFIQLKEKYDTVRLEAAFRQMIDRHESLRTSFELVDDTPVQRVHRSMEFEMEYYDLSADFHGRTESSEAAIRKVEDRFVRPFNLGCLPLLRVGILKGGGGVRVLMVDMHHIITEGPSIEIFVRDFTALYRRESLLPLRLQYKDYARWQTRREQEPAVRRQKEFWLSELSGPLPLLNLPTDFPRPEKLDFAGNRISFTLNPYETEVLSRLRREEGATLFMVLLAIYNVFLARLSGQEDIIVGTAVAGRRHVDLEKIIGMFLNTLVLRNFPHGGRTFREFLHEICGRTTTAFENQDFQFEDLVDLLLRHRHAGRNPLFDVVLDVQSFGTPFADNAGAADSGFTVIPSRNELKHAKFDLVLHCREIHGKLLFTFEYRTSLFKEEKIHRFIGYLREIISIVGENRDIKIEEIRISHGLSLLRSPVREMEFAF